MLLPRVRVTSLPRGSLADAVCLSSDFGRHRGLVDRDKVSWSGVAPAPWKDEDTAPRDGREHR